MPGVHGQTYGQVTRSRKARTSSRVHDACANARRALHTRERSRRKISTTRSEQESWQSVRFAQAVFSFPSCDDIMILDAERCVIWKNRCAGCYADWRHRDDQSASVQGALAASRKAPKDEFQEDGTQKINPSSHRQQRQPEEGTGETPLPHSSQ